MYGAATDELLLRHDGPVLTVTLNRPAKLNLLSRSTIDALIAIAEGARRDRAVRCVVLTGAGDRAFCAGGDLAELGDLDPVSGREFADAGARLVNLLEDLGKPTVAAVNGFALGGGTELALGCTFRLAADRATFGLPEIRHGLMPAFGTVGRLVRLIGSARAAELVLLGDRLPARRAHELGLVHEVVPAAELPERAGAFAARLAALAPVPLAALLRALHAHAAPATECGAREAAMFAACCGTADMKEGTRAFFEKRPPVFTGEAVRKAA